jgi:anti-sigma factor RsiW
MTCSDCIERIDDLHDGRLPRVEIAAMRQHLETCAGCRAWASDVDRIRTAAGMLGPVEPPAGVWTRVAAAVEAAPSVQLAVERAVDWRQWMAAAASG